MRNLYSSIKLPSDPRNVDQVVCFVDALAMRFNLCPEVKGKMMVSLTEAVNNAILHGNGCDCNKQVCISLRHSNGALSVRVTDEGRGFDPECVPDPTAPERIAECGGRGIFLMRNLSDECRFTKGGRTVEMRFKLDM